MFEALFDPNSPLLWLLILSILAGAIAVIARPFSTYVKFVYPNAKFEAMGNPYLSASILQRLAESTSLDQFLEQLNMDKDYNIEGTNAFETQQALDNQLLSFIGQMKKDSSKKMHRFYDVYYEKKDATILKVLLHNIQKHEPINTDEYIHLITSEKLKSLIYSLSDAPDESIPAIIKEYGFTEEHIQIILNEENLPLQIDAIVDAFIIQTLEKVKVPYNCKEGKHLYLARYKDILTIQHLLRAKHLNYHEKLCELLYIGEGYEIPQWKFQELSKVESVQQLIDGLEGTKYHQILKHTYEKMGELDSVQPLTTALDQIFIQLIKEISQHHYVTIGPTLRFLMSKEAEITNLKIISKGVSERLKPEMITSLCIMGVET